MVAIAGLFFECTSPIALVFVALQHNVTLNDTASPGDLGSQSVLYTYGVKDIFTIIFYALVSIVVHAVIQEYILDKLNRRMHLSKVKHSKFNESGQLLIFYAASAAAGYYILFKENYLNNISGLWESYPHSNLSFLVKLYFVLQIAYWIHCFPELYFQKVKKDEIWSRVQYYVIYLIFIVFGYLLNLSLLGLVLLTLHYTVEFLFHISRLFYFAEKFKVADTGFKVWNVVFVLIRLFTITLAVLTLWYGLSKSSNDSIDFTAGNFNTLLVRINCLTAVFLLQAWIMWNFITFHLRRIRDRRETISATTKKSPSSPSSKNKKKSGRVEVEDSRSTDEASADEKVSENGQLKPRGIAKQKTK